MMGMKAFGNVRLCRFFGPHPYPSQPSRMTELAHGPSPSPELGGGGEGIENP